MNGVAVNTLKSSHQIFEDEGILFFPKIFEGEELERLRVACEYIMDRYLDDLDRANPEGGRQAREMRHLNDPRWSPEHEEYRKLIMETVADPRCLGPVEQIFRGESLFRCTTFWFNPRFESSEGNWHRDMQFVLPDEDALKAYFADIASGKNSARGVQFQIALVDNDDVEYVPFSARRYDSPEEYYFRCADKRSHNREAGMPGAMRIHQRAGDAIVFNANGLHRGRYLVDNPRRTFMLTYTPRSGPVYDYFSNQPWLLEDGSLEGLSPRCQAYFQDFTNVYRDFWNEQVAKS